MTSVPKLAAIAAISVIFGLFLISCDATAASKSSKKQAPTKAELNQNPLIGTLR